MTFALAINSEDIFNFNLYNTDTLNKLKIIYKYVVKSQDDNLMC